MNTFPPLTTPRLLIRRLCAEDAAEIFAYRSDPETARFQAWGTESLKQVQDFIESLTQIEPDTPGTWFQVGICLEETGALIGDCGMRFPAEDERQAEIGITLASAYRGQGYAAEALEGIFDYLFFTLGKHRVFGSVDPQNRASLALLERVGMRREAHFREGLWFKGAWVDDVIYAILEKEWKARRDDAR
ncbi:MAG: GNAT family N-acetyltransferase [Chloroflexi bacterium]|nr:GNAT family N-acetyltransferase [Chloroflexota bacterium]